MNKSLYQTLVDAKIELNNHESDLYFPVTPQTTTILNQFPLMKENATKFVDNISGKLSYDVRFCYEPFWIAKCGRA